MHFSFQNLVLLFGIVIIAACTNHANKQAAPQDTVLNAKTTAKPDTPDNAPGYFDDLIWTTKFDKAKRDFVLVKNRDVNADTLTPEKVIGEINAVEASILLRFDRIAHDTIFVSIPDSYYLTQQIGTAGASNYMASTTFSLTELKGIKYVHYDFEEGEHLSPGTMSRDDFKRYQ